VFSLKNVSNSSWSSLINSSLEINPFGCWETWEEEGVARDAEVACKIFVVVPASFTTFNCAHFPESCEISVNFWNDPSSTSNSSWIEFGILRCCWMEEIRKSRSGICFSTNNSDFEFSKVMMNFLWTSFPCESFSVCWFHLLICWSVVRTKERNRNTIWLQSNSKEWKGLSNLKSHQFVNCIGFSLSRGCHWITILKSIDVNWT